MKTGVNNKIQELKVLKKAKKVIKIIGDKEEAKKVINTLIATYDINPLIFIYQR